MLNEEYISAALRYLELHDPKNADRDYAIQLLEMMQGMAHDLAKSDNLNSETFEKALKKMNQA